jgi:hypothetical protein
VLSKSDLSLVHKVLLFIFPYMDQAVLKAKHQVILFTTPDYPYIPVCMMASEFGPAIPLPLVFDVEKRISEAGEIT